MDIIDNLTRTFHTISVLFHSPITENGHQKVYIMKVKNTAARAATNPPAVSLRARASLPVGLALGFALALLDPPDAAALLAAPSVPPCTPAGFVLLPALEAAVLYWSSD